MSETGLFGRLFGLQEDFTLSKKSNNESNDGTSLIDDSLKNYNLFGESTLLEETSQCETQGNQIPEENIPLFKKVQKTLENVHPDLISKKDMTRIQQNSEYLNGDTFLKAFDHFLKKEAGIKEISEKLLGQCLNHFKDNLLNSETIEGLGLKYHILKKFEKVLKDRKKCKRYYHKNKKQKKDHSLPSKETYQAPANKTETSTFTSFTTPINKFAYFPNPNQPKNSQTENRDMSARHTFNI